MSRLAETRRIHLVNLKPRHCTAGRVFDDRIDYTEEKVRYACILPWSPRQLAEQQLMGPRSVHGYLRGEGAFETGPVEFDDLGHPTELRCEVDGADHLECQQVYPYDDTTGRTIRFRRRASLESTRQPLLCDKLFERFLISGGIL